MRSDSYVPHRGLLYTLLWLSALVELGLTGYRLHHTDSFGGFYNPIIVELLVTSVLTLLWIPLTMLFHRAAGTLGSGGNAATTGRSRHGSLFGENGGNFVLWVMWLVGAAITTHHWPNRTLAGSGRQGTVLLTIVAFSWIPFALLTLAMMFISMEHAAVRALNTGGAGTGAGVGASTGAGAGAIRSDKPAQGVAQGAGPGAAV
ncbi:hypothetical protein M0805_001986 [Coniferiporia weirii]|nr:hypothetical protein M0805_001986 [Coniferiporia weirii]